MVTRERPEHHAGVRLVHERAFGRPDEASLVEALRAVDPRISLVALEQGRVVGHVLFTPVTFETDHVVGAAGTSGRMEPPALGLAPLGVLPDRQRRGIGRALVTEGLAACRAAGYLVVFVLGDPAYYGRFGFTRASRRGLRCEFDAPDDAFMVVELAPDALAGRSGVVRYRHEFSEL